MKQGACCAFKFNNVLFFGVSQHSFLLFFCEVPTCFILNGYLFWRDLSSLFKTIGNGFVIRWMTTDWKCVSDLRQMSVWLASECGLICVKLHAHLTQVKSKFAACWKTMWIAWRFPPCSDSVSVVSVQLFCRMGNGNVNLYKKAVRNVLCLSFYVSLHIKLMEYCCLKGDASK